MDSRLWGGFAFLVLFSLFASVGEASSEPSVCARVSVVDGILPPPPDSCSAADFPVVGRGVFEGDEVSLQRALNLVYKNREEYVAVLFHASWCSFSKICRPNFNVMSSLFPSVHHFAFEESVIRPSVLSSDVTGIKPVSLGSVYVEKVGDTAASISEVAETTEQENCPFSWARSPEKLFQEDTYLALASSFVLLRLLYFLIPKLNTCVKRAWRRHMQYASLMNFWDHFEAYQQQAKQGLNRLNPCKRSNHLQEGAKNAKAWASKSLASVSIGDPSSPRSQ